MLRLVERTQAVLVNLTQDPERTVLVSVLRDRRHFPHPNKCATTPRGIETVSLGYLFSAGAGVGERNRTSKPFRAPDPKSGASAVPPRRQPTRLMVSKVLNDHGFDLVGRLEVEDLRVEVELRVDRSADVGRTPEAVLLAFER